MLDVLKGPFRWPGSSSTPVLSKKLVTDNVVSELKSYRAQGLPRDPRGGAPPSGITWSLLRRPDPGRPTHYGEAVWEIEDLQGTSRPWDSSSWRRERLQGYLTIFTINNVVREL
jgi:hypothetical protein